MRKSIFITAAALLCLLGTGYVQAQHVPTLDEVVYGGLIHTKGSTYVNWLEDGEHYSKTEKNPAGGYDIVSYRAKDNKKETLIPASMLVKPGTNDTLSVRSFTFNADHTLALIYTNTRRVWRYDTRGDYWVLDMKDGTLKQLGKGMPESSLMFAKFSPDSRRAAYVSRNNIYVEDLKTGVITPVTTDGTAEIVNGTFDWVYEEEFFCRDGFRWSPDSKYIAYWQSDTKGTGWFDIINNVDSLYPKISRFPYPKAGTTNSAVKVGYVSADGGATTWINIPGDPRNHYIMRMDFIPDSNELFIQQMNRPQNTNKVWIASIGNPEPRNIFTDTDAAWLETNDNVTWLKGNTWFTWESERDGWRHLYRVSRDGKQIVPITKGDFDYIEQAGIDLKRGVVYFIASPDNFTQRYLYSAKLFGKGEVKRESPMDEAGQHSYSMSPTGKWAVHTFSNAVTPPVIDMVSFPGHKSVRMIEDNAEAKAQYQALGLRPKEFVKAKSGDLMLDVCMIKPANFDPNKKYPVIVNFYERNAQTLYQYHMPSPHRSTIDYAFYLSHGYIIFNPDVRYSNYGLPGEDCFNCVMPGITALIEKGYVSTPYIGVTVTNASAQYSFDGALVAGVSTNSPAQEAGLQEGDVITAVNGEAITGSGDLKSKISSSEVSDILSLEVYRNGETIQINVTAGEQNTTSNSSSLEESSSSSSGYRN